LFEHRLLPVESRPFQRIADRWSASGGKQPPYSIIHGIDPTINAANRDEQTKEAESKRAAQLEQFQIWTAEAEAELASYEYNLVKMQHIQDANRAERERYAEEKLDILKEVDAVTESIELLKEELTKVEKIRDQRLMWDELAKVTLNDPNLKPRNEMEAENVKLELEIVELERGLEESDRRKGDRQTKVKALAELLRNLRTEISQEKDEAERKNDVQGVDNDDMDQEDGAIRDKASQDISRMGSRAVSRVGSRAASPRPSAAGEVVADTKMETLDGTRATTPAFLVVPASPTSQSHVGPTSPISQDVTMRDEAATPASTEGDDEGEINEDGEINTEGNMGAATTAAPSNA
jgi:hypothetical protein